MDYNKCVAKIKNKNLPSFSSSTTFSTFEGSSFEGKSST